MISILCSLFISYTPIALKVPYIEADGRINNYHWMRKSNSPEFINYVEAWNRYTANELKKLESETSSLLNDLKKYLPLEYSQKTFINGDYQYYTNFKVNDDLPSYFRKRGDEVELLISDLPGYVIGYHPSPDNQWTAFVVDKKGTQFGDILLFNNKTKHFITDVISNSNGSLVWNPNSKGFWYVSHNPLYRSDKVNYHQLGSLGDKTIFYEPDTQFELSLTSDNQDALFINVQSIDADEIWKLPLKKQGKTKCIFSRYENSKIAIFPTPGHPFYLINKIGSYPKLFDENFKALTAEEDIRDILILDYYIVFDKRNRGYLQLQVLNVKEGKKHEIELPSNIGKLSLLSEKDAHSFEFSFESPLHAPCFYKYNCVNNELTLVQDSKPSAYNPDNYELKREFVNDEIPLTLFYKKGNQNNAPCYLYAYGAYGVTLDPSYNPLYIALADRDFIVAIAHVRGGGELGSQWYEKGKKHKKLTSFNDLVSCAEYLIDYNYTTKMALEGGSAGGTLAAGIFNMRPDLFKVIFLQVPFVNGIKSLSDETIPFTPQEWQEWGNPKTDPEAYKIIRAFSPVDNLKKRNNNPAVAILAGYNDVQVTPEESASYAAKLSECSHNPILFQMNMNKGHLGETGQYSALEEVAPFYAFIINELKKN